MASVVVGAEEGYWRLVVWRNLDEVYGLEWYLKVRGAG
jgi:hypothetical protein